MARRPVPARDPLAARWLIAALALALAAGASALPNGFTLDAQFDLTANAWITQPGHLGELLTHDAWAGAGVASGFWRPLVSLAGWLLWRLGGGAPLAFQLALVALHAGATGLLFRAARRLGATAAVAGIGAALFAVHPVHGDVLGGSAGLKDLLATLGFLAALDAFLAARAAARPAGALARGGLFFALGLLAKENVVALLPALALLDLARGAWRRVPRAVLAAPYGVMALAWIARAGAASALAAGAGPPLVDAFDAASNPLVLLPAAVRPLHALALVPLNAGLLVWPAALTPDRSFNAIPVTENLPLAGLLAGTLIAAALVAAWLVAVRRGALPAADGLALAAAAYLPVSNLVLAIPGQLAAERYLYLPSAGACVAAAWCLAHPALPRRVGYALLALLLAAGLARGTLRQFEWRDRLALWTAAQRTVPDSLPVAHAAAEQLRRAGRFAEARAVLARGLSVEAPSPLTRAVARRWHAELRLALGLVERDAGDLPAAARAMREALALRPERNDWHSELANVLAMDGRFADALGEIDAALRGALDEAERRVLEGRRRKLARSLGAP